MAHPGPAGMVKGVKATRNAGHKVRVTLLHFTINTNQSPKTAGELDSLSSKLESQVGFFAKNWGSWVAVDDPSLVESPSFEGGVEVGEKTGKVHVHLVMKIVHRSWIDLRKTLDNIYLFRDRNRLTTFAYVRCVVGKASEDYMKLYAGKDQRRFHIVV